MTRALNHLYCLINRIDEFIKNCNLNGWLVNAIDIQNRIEIHEKINEEIRFD